MNILDRLRKITDVPDELETLLLLSEAIFQHEQLKEAPAFLQFLFTG